MITNCAKPSTFIGPKFFIQKSLWVSAFKLKKKKKITNKYLFKYDIKDDIL